MIKADISTRHQSEIIKTKLADLRLNRSLASMAKAKGDNKAYIKYNSEIERLQSELGYATDMYDSAKAIEKGGT